MKCPAGRPDAQYSCRFCQVPLHRGDEGCDCSRFREDVTSYASLCLGCANALDTLIPRPGEEKTRMSKIVAQLLQEARLTHWHGDD